jgi:hypothetical protein
VSRIFPSILVGLRRKERLGISPALLGDFLQAERLGMRGIVEFSQAGTSLTIPS